jgi:phage-related minor tail protein
VSEEQAKVGTNLEEMEKARIQRRLEEGRKILEEEENAEEPEVEVMTNRLTDEEKRKYGSTGELLAPEQYEDSNTDAAKEAMGTADESAEVPAEEEGYYGE